MSEETNAPVEQNANNPYLIPGAIVLAGLLIAGGIFASKGPSGPLAAQTGRSLDPQVLPVTNEDHILGPNNPDVYLIEYSDYQCPYCERFHATVKDVVAKYDGQVAWVYRHFPLESIHPEARPSAIAAECAATLGGDEAFWSFTDQIFENQRGMSATRYTEIARNLQLDEGAFTACLASDEANARVDRDLQNVLDVGGQGTPYNVLLTKNGDTIVFSGALPIDRVESLVDRALASLN